MGVLRFLLWVFGVGAVLTDLQRARAKAPHGSHRGDSFADMGSVSKKHLRAKYGAAVKGCVEADVAALRKLQTWLYELADPQLTVVYTESQDESIATHGLCFFRACQLIARLLLNLCARSMSP